MRLHRGSGRRSRAVADGNDLEAREQVAYASTIAGLTMQLSSTPVRHSRSIP